MKKKDKFWSWKGIQYYKFNEYCDILPYIHFTFDCGFISLGWLGYTLSFHILPKIKRRSKYWTLIDKKLYLIGAITDWCSPRIMVHKDTISYLIGPINFEYERKI